jgi:16S rRNA (uracil1498-N3)-methyltransferase
VTPEAAASLRRSAAHVVVDDVSVPVLADADAHHVFRVLRVVDGDVVSVTDGRGAWRLCRAVGGAVEPDGEIVVEQPADEPTTIGFAIPKLDRPEWIVQKLTELGVDRIVLLQAERSVVRWDESRAAKHRSKLERVAVEAVQQCRRVFVPEVVGPVPALSFLPDAMAAEPGEHPDHSGYHTVAIGPEGGWTDRELAVAAGRVSLGPTVLRVETAALVAAARRYHHTA